MGSTTLNVFEDKNSTKKFVAKKLIKDGIRLSLRDWNLLPKAITPAHYKLL